MAACLRSHPGIDLVDHPVAATAWYHERHLMTLNVKHLPMLEALASPW